MLKERVITASILMLTFLIVLFALPWQVFIAAVGGVMLLAAWEWANLAGLPSRAARLGYCALIVVLCVGFAQWIEWGRSTAALQAVLLVGGTWWALAFLWVQGFPSSAVLWRPAWVRCIMGALVFLPSWLSIIYLRNLESGPWLVLMCLMLVAAADVGAYFCGRRFGRRKLAPEVSPGKSWEGVWGGMVLAVVIGLLFGYGLGLSNWIALVVTVLVTTSVSVLGDLLESMVKRVRGVKDSGTLLPGHGGVLDRIDGLVAALPVFSLALLLVFGL